MVLGSVSLAETKSSGKAANDPAYRQASKPYLLSSDVANVSRMTGPTGGEDEKLTAREKRKLRKEFSQLGRDSVRAPRGGICRLLFRVRTQVPNKQWAARHECGDV